MHKGRQPPRCDALLSSTPFLRRPCHPRGPDKKQPRAGMPKRDRDGEGLEYASRCWLPTTWVELPLLSIAPYNHDTAIFEFGLPEGQSLNLPTCACLLMGAPGREHGGGDAVRPYTPISDEAMQGKFQLIVKRYAEWGEKAHPHTYRPAGAVSNHLFSLQPGDKVQFKHIKFNVKIPYSVAGEAGGAGFAGVEAITMVAVGSGIAPMFQALHKLLGTAGDATRVTLLYGNRSVKDILLRERLDKWREEHKDRFKVVYCVGTRWKWHINMKEPPPPEGFETLGGAGEIGWVDEEKVAKHAFPPAPGTRVFVCGLPAVYAVLCGPRGEAGVAEGTVLHKLGYTGDDMVVKF